MTKKAAINRKSISVGPNIVRAWFDTVINPLLEALEREQELLGRKNWSWRYLPEQLEYFRPAQAYLSHRTRSNAEQFFDLFPQIKSAVAKHDKAVDALTNACLRLQKSLLDSAALRTVYEQTTTPESLAELEAKLSDLFGGYPIEDHLALLAQHIVNNSTELPSYYTTAPFWNRYRNEFLALLKQSAFKPQHTATFQQGEALRLATNQLVTLLKECRLTLSLEKDVPYVEAQEQSSLAAFQRF